VTPTKNERSAPSPAKVCEERQRLLDRLRDALEDLGAAVRDLREPGGRSIGVPAEDEAREAARSACEKIWADLQHHQSVHKCWR
jgi:hypothetical protein